MHFCALVLSIFAIIALVNCEVFYEENFNDGKCYLDKLKKIGCGRPAKEIFFFYYKTDTPVV